MKVIEKMKRYRGRIALILLALAAIAWFGYEHRENISREAIQTYGKALPAGWFIAAFFVLPLVGFPISILLVLAGIRFGMAGGMGLAAAGILFHHFAAFHLTHGSFRHRVRQWLDDAGHAIPPIKAKNRIWFTALFAAIHGPPYVAKLYLLALTDLPLRIYLWVGAPVYIAFCPIAIGAGSAVMHMDPTWIYVVVGAGTAVMLAGHWLKKRYGAREDGGGISD